MCAASIICFSAPRLWRAPLTMYLRESLTMYLSESATMYLRGIWETLLKTAVPSLRYNLSGGAVRLCSANLGNAPQVYKDSSGLPFVR